jgi:hypothetical protein
MHPFAQSLLGGVLIGASASGLLLVNGRIAGVSGVLAGATSPRPQAWQWAFLAGLAATAVAARLIGQPVPAGLGAQSLGLLAAAGLLVGFGARLGSGCTSGHGVCGLGALSPRSATAMAVFMSVAAAVVFVTHHVAPAQRLLAGAGLP